MTLQVTYGPGFSKPDSASLLVVGAQGVTFNVPDRSPAAIRKQISELTDRLLAMPPSEQREFEVEHSLIDGVYMRKLTIPKGSVLVGKIHLKECMNVVAKGDISVLTESGAGRFKAGDVAISGPGIQKVGYAHEDTVFINVFRTDETSIEKIEAEIATEDKSCLLLG